MTTGMTIGDSGISAATASYAPAVPYTGQAGSMSSDQIDKTAKDFESMFIGQMLEPMFGESGGDEAFGSSASGDVYKGLLMDEYGKQITLSGGIGIADYVKKELLKLQEAANSAGDKSSKRGSAQAYSKKLQEN